MANPSDEDLRALRQQVAVLTARVYELEKRAGIEIGAPQPQAAAPPPPLQPIAPQQVTPVAPPKIESLPEREPADLEGKIGRVWLNRIGIMAILAGVAYFIKYAFDTGWIGPGGRVAIGLVAGI